MPQSIAKFAGSWFVKAGVPTLALAGFATFFTSLTTEKSQPTSTSNSQIAVSANSETQSPEETNELPENSPVPRKLANPNLASRNEKLQPFLAETTPDTQASSRTLNSSPSSSQSSKNDVKVVTVFYATDRAASDIRSQIPWVRGVIPLSIAIVAMFGIIGLAPGMTQRWWPVVALLGVVVVSFLGHSLWIRTASLYRMSARYGAIFGSDRFQAPKKSYPLQLGYCDVSIPPTHAKGKLETPRWSRMEWRLDESKHVILQTIKPAKEDEYFKRLSDRLNSNPKNEILVFIHGYNVGFADAVRRTAQLHHDLDFPGAPICYSWPSVGLMSGYTKDEASVGWSVAHLEKFISDLKNRTNASKVHLIAHSMGNRALVGALERLILKDSSASKWLGQIVMAAPDVDSGELANRYLPTIVPSVQRVTLYTSKNDKALLASTALHGARRAGIDDASRLIFSGVETIDVSSINTGLLGHSYYGEHPDLIKDLRALVELNRPAEMRDWLRPVQVSDNEEYWIFQRPRVAHQSQPNVSSGR